MGAAVISAVFYAGVRGAPPAGAAREAHYGHAYALALCVSVLLTLSALALSLRLRWGAARLERRVEQAGH